MKSPIRVLHLVTKMDRGGIETMLMNYYREIDRTKVQFDFLVHREDEGSFDKEIIELGGRIFHMPAFRARNLTNYNRQLITLIDNHPELKIFHSHLNSLSAVPLTIAKRKQIPVRIAHSHTAGYQEQSTDWIRRLLKRDLLKRQIPRVATQLAACSQTAADFMFGKNAPFLYIKNAISPDRFQFDSEQREKIRKEFSLSPETLVIGNVGNLNFPKNQLFLLKILLEILPSRPDTKLLLVGGPGNASSDIQDFVEAKGIEESVILTGPRSDVNLLLQAMDIFVMPSLLEGLPVISIEAQTSGLPCIFSKAVTPELAITDNCTFISLEKSPKFWAQEVLEQASLSTPNNRGNGIKRQVTESGYDATSEAQHLTKYYLNSFMETQ